MPTAGSSSPSRACGRQAHEEAGSSGIGGKKDSHEEAEALKEIQAVVTPLLDLVVDLEQRQVHRDDDEADDAADDDDHQRLEDRRQRLDASSTSSS